MTKPNPVDLAKAKLASIYEEADRASAKSLRGFLDRIVIDSAGDPRCFGQIAEPWQIQRNDLLTPIIEKVAGFRPNYKGPMQAWMGYAKGQDKTSTIARYFNWMLSYSTKPLRMLCAAKDKEQAEITRDFMEKEAKINNNRWFGKKLTFGRSKVENEATGARVDFLTSDAGGSHGRTPDFICLDELTNWVAKDLFDSLFSAVVKRGGHCGLIILTNAGHLGSWQHAVREMAREQDGKSWLFFEQGVGQQLASWMTPELIAQAAQFLSPVEARRLYRNEWIDPAEAGIKLFSPADVDACIGNPLPPPPGSQVFFGVDYGGTCDRTAMVVLWYDTTTSTIHIQKIDCYQGSPDNEVRIADVEKWLDLHWGMYPNAIAVLDTMGQLLGTAQKYEDAGKQVKRVEYRGGKTNALMCQCLKALLTNRQMVFAPNCGLIGSSTLADELKSVIGKQMIYGERIDHSSKDHDDRVIVTGQTVIQAIQNTEKGWVPQQKRPETPQAEQKPVVPPDRFARNWAAKRGLFGMHQ